VKVNFGKIQFIFALCFLAICFITTPISYFFCVDDTKYANTQTTQIALISPGSTVCMYKNYIRKDESQTNIQKYIFGSDEVYNFSSTSIDSTAKPVCRTYIFGTDKYGRDVYSRIVIGIRYTLILALCSVITALIIGIILGALAGYFGGIMDQLINLLINVFWTLPTILLAFAVLFAFGRNMSSIFIAIACTMWSDIARLVRGQVLYYKEMNFIKNGISMGFSHTRILFLHIIPNILNPIWISCAANFALAVLLESGLSFLGLGLSAPIPTLGNILQEQYPYAIAGKALLAIIPSIIVVLLILSFQILTNYLRDKWDVRMQI
jgi:peptide/nickel transport system permease protein